MSSTVEAVRKAVALAGFDERELQSLSESLELQRFPVGGWIFREGGPPDAMYLVAAGSVTIGRGRGTSAELARVLTSLGPGASFGEQGLLLDEPRSAGAVAATDCTLYRLSRESFDRLLAAQDRAAVKLMRNVARDLSRRLRELDRRLDALERAERAVSPDDVGALRQRCPD